MSDSKLPLAGVKVMDFSWAVVGNTCAKMLGDLGADMLKIENPGRASLERMSRPVKNVPVAPPNDNPWFANLATSKFSLTLDMRNPASREVVDAIIDWADLVLENFSPGTMDKLGVGWDALRARKPSIIMASGSIFGQTGPLGSLGGSEVSGSAWSGRVFMTGEADRPPNLPGLTYGDSVTPFLLATAVIAALENRDRTGEGCRIDAAMVEALGQQMLPYILEAQHRRDAGEDERLPRTGNRSPRMSPHGVFPASGEDMWIAIAVETDAQFASLCQMMDRPELARDERFATLAARKANEDELEAIVADYTRVRDRYDTMMELQAAGVPAGAVQHIADVMDRDPQIAHRRHFRPVEHKVIGTFDHERTPVELTKTPGRMFPAPGLGEHTEMICREMLGFSAGDFERLREQGVFGKVD